MDGAERKELMEYLKDAIQQESNIVTQERIIAEYDAESERRKPNRPEQKIVQHPNHIEKKSLFSNGFVFMMVFLIVSL